MRKPAPVVEQTSIPIQTQTPITQQPTPTTPKSENVYSKIYKNDEIGIEFRYPSDWQGFRAHKISSDESPLYKGAAISICNEPNCLFKLSAYTPDFEFLGMPTVGEIEYGGQYSDQLLNCAYYEITQECKTFEIEGEKAISAYVTLGASGGLHMTRRIVLIENPRQKFAGIVMQYSLSGFDVRSVNDPETNAAYLLDVKNNLARNELTPQDKSGLEIFDKIVSSVKFIR